MSKPIYFYVLFLVFIIAILLNFILLINPHAASESIETASIILFIVAVLCGFLALKKPFGRKSENVWNIILMIIIYIYSTGIASLGILNIFFPDKVPTFYNTSLRDASLALLSSAIFLNMYWLQIKEVKK